LKRIAEAEEGQQAGADVLALHGDVVKAIEREARALAASHTLERDPASWPLENLQRTVAALHPEAAATLDMEALRRTEDANRVTEAVVTALVAAYERACAETDPVLVARAERIVTLRAIDTHWMDHIDDMSHLREQVAFSGYAQRDPLVEYQDQGFRRFQQLLATIDATIVRVLLQVDFQQFAAPVRMAQPAEDAPAYVTNEAQIEAELEQTGVAQSVRQARPPTQPSPVARRAPLPHERRGAAPQPPRPSGAPAASAGRNDPCPCGSGKKFKKCHGAEA
jgi:preprotein translocase subunit SecA